MKRISKWLSLLLALVLVFGLTAVGAAAEEADETDEPQLVTASTEDDLIAYAQDGIYQIVLVTEDISLTQDIITGDYIEFGGFKNNNEGWLVLGDYTLTANQVTIDIVDSDDFANAAAMIEADKVIDLDDGLIELAVYGEVEIEKTLDLSAAVIILVNNDNNNNNARLLLADGVELACDSINCIENGEWVDALSKTNAYGIAYYVTEDLGEGMYWINNVLYPTEEAMLAAMKAAQDGGTQIYGVQLGTYKLPTENKEGTPPGTITLGSDWDGIDLIVIQVLDSSTLVIDTGLTITTLSVASMDNGKAAQVIVKDGASLDTQLVFINDDTENETPAQLIVEDRGSLTINDSYGYSYIQGDLRYGEGATVKLPDGISIDGEYPALLWHWLSGDDDGLYEQDDDNFSDSFGISPGDEFYVVFYARTWDAEKEAFVYTAVDPEEIDITGEGLILSQDDLGIHENEKNGDKFVRISCEIWNQDYVLNYEGVNPMYGNSYQPEVAFYSDYDGREIQLDDYINWYGYNPVQENEFYFALSNDAEYWLTDVALTEESSQYATLTTVEEGRVYKLTVKDKVVKSGNNYDVILTFGFANDEGDWDGYDAGIGIGPTGAIAWKDGAVWYDKENHVPDNDAYTASYYDHLKGQLTGSLNLTEGETRDGVVYIVNYDWDAHLWRCDPYPAASIWTSNKDAASLTQISSDWQDWGGLESTLTAGESGTAEIYTKVWNEDSENDPENVWTDAPETWTIPLTVTVTSKSSKPGTSKPSTGSTSTSTSTGTTAAPELPFTDVSENASYYDAVKYVYDHDLMNGTSETRFSPSGTLNRAMVATILYRLEGEPAAAYTGAFTDVADGTWYTGGVEWAARNGIVDGYGNGKFGPTDPVTREQLAAMLYRYARYKGYDVTRTVDLANYTDGANTSAYAVDAVEWAAANGILESANGKLRPREAATRAEVAVAVAAFHEAFVK